mgnify:CR=1 FL=1
MPTILILDNIAEEGIRLLEAEDGFDVEVRDESERVLRLISSSR